MTPYDASFQGAEALKASSEPRPLEIGFVRININISLSAFWCMAIGFGIWSCHNYDILAKPGFRWLSLTVQGKACSISKLL